MLVEPMRQELRVLGFQEPHTAEEVDTALQQPGTTMIVINSVCGCAAGGARPGIALALKHKVIPDNLVTVFAGQDLEATERARSYFTGTPPSSPAIALMRDGELLGFMPRHHIEGRTAEMIAEALTTAFDQYCQQQTA